jgi:transglutaminase-like putative cysteine protease
MSIMSASLLQPPLDRALTAGWRALEETRARIAEASGGPPPRTLLPPRTLDGGYVAMREAARAAKEADKQAIAAAVETLRNDLAKATRSIHQYVHTNMKTNAGMGVLRNAEQVLGSMEGVCRDHAILATTLFRAANIPARLVGGMIYSDGAFYYHAWTEIWDGSQWVGVDTTLPEMPISAVHLKLASGNVDKAFSFKFLADTKIKVAKTLSR